MSRSSGRITLSAMPRALLLAAVTALLLGMSVACYWLRVSGVARVGEHARSGEDLGLSRRCDGFAILCVGSRNFIIPSLCEITTRSAPSQFGTGFLVDASRSGVG
jgi:hypothetical protein